MIIGPIHVHNLHFLAKIELRLHWALIVTMIRVTIKFRARNQGLKTGNFTSAFIGVRRGRVNRVISHPPLATQ